MVRTTLLVAAALTMVVAVPVAVGRSRFAYRASLWCAVRWQLRRRHWLPCDPFMARNLASNLSRLLDRVEHAAYRNVLPWPVANRYILACNQLREQWGAWLATPDAFDAVARSVHGGGTMLDSTVVCCVVTTPHRVEDRDAVTVACWYATAYAGGLRQRLTAQQSRLSANRPISPYTLLTGPRWVFDTLLYAAPDVQRVTPLLPLGGVDGDRVSMLWRGDAANQTLELPRVLRTAALLQRAHAHALARQR